MEPSGAYWVLVYEILEKHGFEVVLSIARDTRTVPRRKTNVGDTQLIQRLHVCGLLKASFRPDATITELRGYMRVRELYSSAYIKIGNFHLLYRFV